MTPLLDIRDLSVSFRTRAGLVPTLDKVSLQLGRGEILGLVGESGAGKSLTGLALTGLLPPNAVVTAGSVRFDGQEVLGLSEAALRRIRGRRIGMVFQDPMTALDPLMRIGEQLVETIRHHLRLSRGAALDRAGAILGATSPRGGLAVFWRVAAGTPVGQIAAGDVCGIAAGPEAGSFVLTSGLGGAWMVWPEQAKQAILAGSDTALRWDNHLTRL